MKIAEVTNIPHTYVATVRVVLRGTSCTVRTTISADTASDAKKLLSSIVGDGNVLSLSRIVTEAPQSDQIQREAAIRPHLVRRQAQPRKVAQIQLSQVQQLGKRPKKRQVSARPIPAPIKHDLVQNRLTKQLIRQSNNVKPTSDDIRIAKSRADTALKRADLEYQKQMERVLRTRNRNQSPSH